MYYRRVKKQIPFHLSELYLKQMHSLSGELSDLFEQLAFVAQQYFLHTLILNFADVVQSEKSDISNFKYIL